MESDTLDTDDDYDSLMDMLGLGDALEPTPEIKFIRDQTAGSTPKLINYYHWLTQIMAQFQFQKEEGIRVTKSLVRDGKPGSFDLSPLEYATTMSKYYLFSVHGSRFFKDSGIDKALLCDVDVVINLLLDLEPVRKIIWKKF